jgi:hypothetical protein
VSGSLELELELSEMPNIASIFSNCVAAALSWTISRAGAFSKAETTFEDDNAGELTLERVWSKFSTPGLIEEAELMKLPP